jgi:hypothetical protein
MLTTNMRPSVLLMFLVFTSLCVYAQKDDGLGRVNVLITDGQQLLLQKKDLVIQGFKDGKLVKTDRVSPFDLDPDRMIFIDTERIVMLPCGDDADECIERRRMPDGQRNHRQRLHFEVSDLDHANSLMTAIRDFLSPYQK